MYGRLCQIKNSEVKSIAINSISDN